MLENGNLLAHFGYQSDEASSLTLAVGVKNNVSPGSGDVGQPTTFFKGRFNNVFTVVVPIVKAEVRIETVSNYTRWTLGDTYADATAETARCSPQEIRCQDQDNRSAQAQLDNLAARQRQNIRALSKRILQAGRSKTYAALAQSYVKQAQELYNQQWTTIWSRFSQVTKTCTGCAAIDKSSNIAEITERSKKLLRLSKLAASTLKKAKGGRLNSTDSGLVNTATTLHERTLNVSKELPTFDSQCG